LVDNRINNSLIAPPYPVAYSKHKTERSYKMMKGILIKATALVLLTVCTSLIAILLGNIYPKRFIDTKGSSKVITDDKCQSFLKYEETLLKSDVLSKPEYTYSMATASGSSETTAVLPVQGASELHLQSQLLINELVLDGIISFWNAAYEDRYLDYKSVNCNLSWVDAVTYVNIGLDHPFYTSNENVTNSDQLTVLINKYHCISKDYIPQNLVRINKSYSIGSIKLCEEACTALEEMCLAANTDSITMQAVSAYRSFDYQNVVYDRKKTEVISLEAYQKKRDKTVARAGHSEHQTGLAVDIGGTDDTILKQSFENTDAGVWLAKNSYRFGFILRYPKDKESITGYNYEPWHFRYLGIAIAEKVYLSGLTYDEFCARNLLIY